jgi:DNA-directed RNA polymerase subunit L
MPKVKNVKVEEIPFESKDANFQKCLDYIKLVDPNYKKYLPETPKQQLTFELTETSSELANCIRRFLIGELPVYSMDVDEETIETNDSFILSDYLKKNIELIPFNQGISDSDADNLRCSLTMENKTDDIITVYSGDLDMQLGKTPVKSSKYFSSTIPIIKLRPAMSLSIEKIGITQGVAKQNAGKFLLLANVSYKIMDIKPVEESKYNRTGESSLNSTPRHFRIGYKTHRNIEPKKVMNECCAQITSRITNIQKELANIKSDTNVHFSDLIDLESKGDVKIFHFKGEYWTLANIMSKYCYLTDKDVPFVSSGIIHPSTEESLLKLRHTNPTKLLTAAIKSILADIATISKAFS